MGSESLHAPRERLSRRTLTIHHAIVSIMEELEAVDWYRQRADDCEDAELREILLHNMREEIEHAAMALEWLRRYDADVDEQFRTYLFTDKPILQVEDEAEGDGGEAGGGGEGGEGGESGGERGGSLGAVRRPTVGSLKGKGRE
ncbi:ferritin [Caenispirillum bisanense]|uniref:ferritin family protein n=1 Tax=Caenispirillum bisanense TaxID=414052 RepID=UPI0031E24D69